MPHECAIALQTCHPPRVTITDFICFIERFAAGQSYANCDGSTSSPTLTANDFQCFMNMYTAGCT